MADSIPKVIFVCWGNICRSPMAEQVARAVAERDGLDVEIDSAGTSTEELGNPIDPRAADTLRQAGYDVGRHVARQISADELAQADLVVAMESLHVDRLRRIAGVTSGAGPDADRFDAKVRLLSDFDPDAEPGSGLADPWYGPDAAFADTLAAVEAAVPGVLAHLGGGDGDGREQRRA